MAVTYNAGVGYVDENGGVVSASRSKDLYSVGTLAPTDAIDSGDLVTAGCGAVLIAVKNGHTTLTRTISIVFKNEAGATVHTITPTAIATATTVVYVVGIGSAATGITAAYAIPPSAKIQVTCAAPGAGAGNGYVYIYGR